MSRRGRTPPDIANLHSVMVFNISYRTRKEELHRSFEKFGEIADVYIPRDRYGESRGFGFVRYYERGEAEEARSMDGKMLDGRRIGVQMAKYGRRHDINNNNRRRRYASRSRSRSNVRHRGYGGGRGGYGGGRRRRYNSRSRSFTPDDRRRSGRYQGRSRYHRRNFRSRSRSQEREHHTRYQSRSFSGSEERHRSDVNQNENVKKEELQQNATAITTTTTTTVQQSNDQMQTVVGQKLMMVDEQQEVSYAEEPVMDMGVDNGVVDQQALVMNTGQVSGVPADDVNDVVVVTQQLEAQHLAPMDNNVQVTNMRDSNQLQ